MNDKWVINNKLLVGATFFLKKRIPKLNHNQNLLGALTSNTILSTWHVLTHSIFKINLWGSYYYYPHLIDDETEEQRYQIKKMVVTFVTIFFSS